MALIKYSHEANTAERRGYTWELFVESIIMVFDAFRKLQGSEENIYTLEQFSESLEMNCFYGETKQSRMGKESYLQTGIF